MARAEIEQPAVCCQGAAPGACPAQAYGTARRAVAALKVIDFQGQRPDTAAMGVRTRGLDIKAGAAKLKADRAAREEANLLRIPIGQLRC